MVRGIYVEPDKGISRVRQTARFDHEASVPERKVRERIFPEMANQWVRDFAKRGYTLDSRIYLFPRRYAHIEVSDNGAVTKGTYEHDQAKREVVDRCMTAYFRVKDIVVSLLPDAEKAAILAQVRRDLEHERARSRR